MQLNFWKDFREDRAFQRIAGFGLLAIFLLAIAGIFFGNRFQPNAIAPSAPDISHSQLRIALYASSRVYGKAGCGDFELADATARWALRRGLDAGLVAAVVAVESHCDPLAVSTHHAVGLMQLHTPDWGRQYDFARNNPFDSETNLRIGTEILARMAAKYGVAKGVENYCGEGPEARAYAKKVMETMK